MTTMLSQKRQISIPKVICDQLKLKPGARIDFEIQDGKLVGHPLPPDGWRSLIGKYKGSGMLRDLLKDRKEDRERA